MFSRVTVQNNSGRTLPLADAYGRTVILRSGQSRDMRLAYPNSGKLLRWRRSGLIKVSPYVPPAPTPPSGG